MYKEIDVANGEFSGINFGAFSEEDYKWEQQLLIAKCKIYGDAFFFHKAAVHELLDNVAIKALDNPNCNVDDERPFSTITWMTGSKLNGWMSGATMIARLMGDWNDAIFKWMCSVFD